MKKKLGRKPMLDDALRKSIYLSSSDAEFLRKKGGGNLSLGLRLVINTAQSNTLELKVVDLMRK